MSGSANISVPGERTRDTARNRAQRRAFAKRVAGGAAVSAALAAGAIGTLGLATAKPRSVD